MKFLLSWLKQHLQTDATLDEIIEKLIHIGIEVENIYDASKIYQGFILGQIRKIEKHPNADRLFYCTIDVGQKDHLKIVCGAQNLYENMFVPVATPNAVIPSNGDVLKTGKIRGIESFGMLCTAKELNISNDHSGILDIKTEKKPGTPLADALDLNDPIIDVSITPNRSDCFSVYGIARDLAAAGLGNLQPLQKISLDFKANNEKAVHIQTSKCLAFQGIWIEDTLPKQSPEYIQKRLKSAGINPQNLLIDITNYVALDLGHPMHAYDTDKINSNHIIVREAQRNEHLIGLNDQYIKLDTGDIVIASSNQILALAGIMGGKESGVSEQTKNILLESAVFDQVQTALSGQKHNIISESRIRFERGVDPLMAEKAIEYAAQIILKSCGGKIVKRFSYRKIIPLKTIIFFVPLFSKKTNIEIDIKEAQIYLEKLGMQCILKDNQNIEVTIPSWRNDLSIPEDLIEEILRLKGYDQLPVVPLKPLFIPKKENRIELLKERLRCQGLQEVYTLSFIQKKNAQRFSAGEIIELNNPSSQEMNTMRPSLIPSLIEIAFYNLNKGQEYISIFEISPLYKEKEELCAAGLRAKHTNSRTWYEKHRQVDIYDIKADCLAALNIDENRMQLSKNTPPYYHPGQSGSFHQGKNILAYFGQLHPSITDLPLVVFEIFMDRLPQTNRIVNLKKQSPYPIVKRDLSFIVDKDLPANELVQTIQKIDPLIHNVSLFDVYEGKPIEENKKAIAIQFFLQSPSKTLSEDEISPIIEKILDQAKKKCNARLRYI